VGRYPENLFYDPEQENGQPALIGTPGLTLFGTTKIAQVRNGRVFGGYLYVVVGDTCFQVNTAGTATALATTLDTSTGHVFMKDNGTQLMITDGTSGYIVTGTTLTKITDEDFPTPSSLAYQDGYFIVTEADSGRIYISGSYDGTTWDALDYTTAEGHPDDALVVISDHRELWIFGEETAEIYYNSGDADFPFERIQGAYIEAGIGAVASVIKADNTLWWLTNHAQFVRADGYNPKTVSTNRINREIAGYGTWSDAVGYSYTQEGHTFCVLSFPSANKTWVYDVATRLWHRRTSYQAGLSAMGRHRSNCYALFDNKHIVGDYTNGNLYYSNTSAYTDNGEVIRAVHTAPAIEQDRKNIFHDRMEIEFKAGVGLSSGQGSDPQAMLQFSDDDGRTWSNELWRSIGKIGKYENLAVWERMGKSKNRAYRLIITDPIERVIYGGFLEARLGRV